MPVVSIALEEGFEDDAVEVQVGDQVVVRHHVRTRTTVGFAELVDVTAPAGRCAVQVRLPGRHLRTELPISIQDDDVHVRVQAVDSRLTAELVDRHRYA